MDLAASLAHLEALWNIFTLVAGKANNIVATLLTSSITLRNVTDESVTNITFCCQSLTVGLVHPWLVLVLKIVVIRTQQP